MDYRQLDGLEVDVRRPTPPAAPEPWDDGGPMEPAPSWAGLLLLAGLGGLLILAAAFAAVRWG